MARYEDISGQTFNNLTAVSYVESGDKGGARWLFLCACGGEKIANATEVKRGKTKSCGCLAHVQKIAAAQTKCHPYSRTNMYRERKSWEGMIARCYVEKHKAYSYYGGRGITVCDRWRNSFVNFADDMGPRPEGMTLDRIDNSLSYSKENCCWSSSKTQMNNTRRNRLVTIDGVTRTVAQWAEIQGINAKTINARIDRGMIGRDAVTKPVP